MSLNILNELFETHLSRNMNSCFKKHHSSNRKDIIKMKRKPVNTLFNFSELNHYELRELSAIYNAICSIIDAPVKPNTNLCFDFDKKDIFSRLKKEFEWYVKARGYAVKNDFVVPKHCLENDTL